MKKQNETGGDGKTELAHVAVTTMGSPDGWEIKAALGLLKRFF